MSTSNVRSIESLQDFKSSLLRLGSDWDKTTEEIRIAIQRIDEYFQQERPAYWRRQTQLAERELNEAKDNLSRMRAAIRPGDAAPATEAAQRVIRAQRRQELCYERQRQTKKWAIEIKQQCDALLGPLADLTEHSQTLLPAAAQELGMLVEKLRDYAGLPESGPAST